MLWLFDHSSCHRAFAEDAPKVKRMNIHSEGEQLCMGDTVWAGKTQKMVDGQGHPKGMKQVLKGQGINTSTMNVNECRRHEGSSVIS